MINRIKANIRWSKSVKIITGFSISMIAIGVLLISLSIIKDGFNWIGVVVMVLISFIFIYTFISAPIYILIDENYIIIKKNVGSKRINRSELINVYSFNNKGHNIRILGSGGLFGYTGIFKNKFEGRYISYVGDYKQAFFLILKNKKKYLISSEHKELIVSILKKNI